MFFIVTWQDSSEKTNYQRLSADNLEEAKKIMWRKGVSSRNCKFEEVNESKKDSDGNKNENSTAKAIVEAVGVANNNLKEGVGAAITDAKANKLGKIFLLLVVQLLIIGIIQFASLMHSVTARKWDYRLVAPSDYLFEGTMKDLGNEGWELVNARRATSKHKNGASYEMIFKKKKL